MGRPPPVEDGLTSLVWRAGGATTEIPEMLTWKIGDVTVTRVVETTLPTSPRYLFGTVSKAEVLAIDWLRPHFIDQQGLLTLSIHAFLLESRGERIVVDTCIGNGKQRTVADWNLRAGPFLEDIARAGFPRESVDTVLCTHLHVDHVGWNTMRVDGRWVPTFPNARYLFAREEWAHWERAGEEHYGPVLEDSVRPIIEAGRHTLVETDHELTDEVHLEPTPGHTPGHVSVHIRSRGEEAVITGDMTHHPAQLAHPEWSATVDHDPERSRTTRQAFYARYSDRPVLILGTHFATPSAGHIVREGEAWRLVV